MASDGAAVTINYAHNSEQAQEVVATIEQKGGKAIAVPGDVSKITDIESLFKDNIITPFGKVDILVNNAGVGKGGTIAEVTEEDYETDLINLSKFE